MQWKQSHRGTVKRYSLKQQVRRIHQQYPARSKPDIQLPLDPGRHIHLRHDLQIGFGKRFPHRP
jgi:hypothetical protein